MVITADAPSFATIEEYENLPAHKGRVKVGFDRCHFIQQLISEV